MASSSALQKLIRRQSQSSVSKILTHFRNPQFPILPQIANEEPHLFNNPKSELQKPNNNNNLVSNNVYPSFSFEFFLDPMSPTSLIRHVETTKKPDEDIDDETDDSGTMKADSVKKKRKKKMNKHKLRKLRKRLRRKTKT